MRAGEDAGDAAADDHHVDVVDDRLALGVRGEGVVAVAGEVLVAGQIADVGAAGDQPLVALGQVLGVHGFGVEGHGFPFGGDHAYVTNYIENVKHPVSLRTPGSEFVDCITSAGAAMVAPAVRAAGGMGNPLMDSIIGGWPETSLPRARLPTASMRQRVVMEPM